ncbi:hypothetical protein SAMN05661093_00407 [Kibdelosporangium aridum]|uniref:Uncharacterized protein n=1 Tax=Kibdelosporangium aridum TaxID=2030 RepID=A0A1Y5WUY7_KIBAR|nr:hypothetical protein SAMN05661093_00407 [Kibdelosporangium aridum]
MLWNYGTIDLPRAKAVHDYTEPLGNEQVAEVEKRVLDNGPHDNLTKFKRGLHGEVIRADPEGAEERRRLANAQPGTTTRPNPASSSSTPHRNKPSSPNPRPMTFRRSSVFAGSPAGQRGRLDSADDQLTCSAEVFGSRWGRRRCPGTRAFRRRVTQAWWLSVLSWCCERGSVLDWRCVMDPVGSRTVRCWRRYAAGQGAGGVASCHR